MKRLAAGICWFFSCFAIFGFNAPARADLPAAAAWLVAQQQADGSFAAADGVALPLQASAEALQGLVAYDTATPSTLERGLSYLASDSFESTEYLGRVLDLRRATGADPGAIPDLLRARVNQDGGAGELPGYASTALDTAFLLQALAGGHPDGILAYAAGFLLAAQGPEGGWALGPGDEDGIYLTALAARALWHYRNVYRGVPEALERAAAFLLERRGPGGGWGDTALNALSLLALLPVLEDPGRVATAVQTLAARQRADGSWDGDVYLTALSLRALSLAGQSQPNPDLAGVGVRVVHAELDMPLLGAVLSLQGPQTRGGSTDAAGRHLFAGLPPGTYTLDVGLDGFEGFSGSFVLAQGDLVDLATVRLLSRTDADRGSIAGTVRDAASGQALADTVISAWGAVVAVTDREGRYQAHGVPAGGTELRARRAGYATGVAPATIAAGNTLVYSPRLEPLAVGEVAGMVSDAQTGEPLEGATVSVFGPEERSVLTAGDGSYSLDGVAAGTPLVLSALKAGYDSFLTNVQLLDGETLSFSPRLRARPPGGGPAYLRGTVTSGDTGTAVAGARIELTGASSASVFSNADGSFQVEGLSPGPTRIGATASGFRPFSTQLELTAEASVLFSVSLDPLEETAPAPVTLTGAVLDGSTRAPLPGVALTLDMAGDVAESLSGPDGAFVVSAAGFTGVLTLSRDGYRPLSIGLSLQSGETRSLGELGLIRADSVRLLPDLLAERIDVSGLVRGPDGLDVSGVLGVDVVNAGTVVADALVELQAFYDADLDGAFDPVSDLALGHGVLDLDLAGGEGQRMELPVSGTLPFRDAPVSVWVDSRAQVEELSEDNNRAVSAAGTAVLEPLGGRSRTHYGFSPDTQGDLILVGLEDATEYTLRSLDGVTAASGKLERLERRVVDLRPFLPRYALETSAPVLAIAARVCCGDAGNFFYPAPDGVSHYATSFVITRVDSGFDHLDDNTVVFAAQDAEVVIRDHSGALVASSPPLTPGSFWLPRGLRQGGVYTVEASGLIAVANNTINGGTQVPPLPDRGHPAPMATDDVGTGFLFPTHNWEGGALAVMNPGYTPARFTLRNIRSGQVVLVDQAVAPGDVYFRRGLGLDYYALDVSVGAVSVWAGDLEAGNRIGDMGDDIINNLGRSGTRFVVDSQNHGATVFAGLDDTAVAVNGTLPVLLNEDEFLYLPPNRRLLITASRPVTVQTAGGNALNDWATCLRPAMRIVDRGFDLSASRISLIDNGVGQVPDVQVRVGNGGVESPPEPVRVALLRGNPGSGGAILSEVETEPLATGGYRDLRLPAVGWSGTEPLYVRVDADDRLEELDEENNDATVPLDAAFSSTLGRVAVTTDFSAYGPGDELVARVEVINTGALATRLHLRVVVETADARLIAPLGPFADVELPGGGRTVIAARWNTGTTLSGIYRVSAVLENTQGFDVDRAFADFAIGADADPPLRLGIFTDRPLYHTTDEASVDVAVVNQTSNLLVNATTLSLRASGGSGDYLFERNLTLGDLYPGTQREIALVETWGPAAPGPYRLEAEVRDGTGRLLAVDETAFEVEPDPRRALHADVDVARARLHVGEPQLCSAKLNVESILPTQGVRLRLALLDLDRADTVEGTETTVDGAPGHIQTLLQSFDTHGLHRGAFACALQFHVVDRWDALGFAAFQIEEPPVRIDAGLGVGSRGPKTLVLVDSASPAGGDPQSPPAESPGVEGQVERLTRVLDTLGRPYSVVRDALAFTGGLRSGGYGLHLVLSEQVELPAQVEKELREAVYRGEGLVVAGLHDHRNQGVADALGVKVKGRLAGGDSVSLVDSDLHPVASLQRLSEEKPLRAEAVEALPVGYFVGDPGSVASEPAVALNDYGNGRAVYIGFDLLAEMTLGGEGSPFGSLLAAALEYAQAEPDFLAGSVLPLAIHLVNRGIATTGRVVLPLPSGVSAEAALSGYSNAAEIVWPINLGPGEARELLAWVRLPSAAEPVVFNVRVQTGGPTGFIDHTQAQFTVHPQALPRLDDLIAELELLAAQDNAFEKALRHLEDAAESLAVLETERALGDLVKACDDLMGILSEEAPAVRTGVARLIRAVASGIFGDTQM